MRQLALIVVPILVLAADVPLYSATGTAGDDNGQRQRRTEYMKSLANRHVVVAADNRQTPLTLANDPVLRYTTLARLCSRPVEVKLDGKLLWSAANYWTSPRSIGDAYAQKLMGSYRHDSNYWIVASG